MVSETANMKILDLGQYFEDTLLAHFHDSKFKNLHYKPNKVKTASYGKFSETSS